MGEVDAGNSTRIYSKEQTAERTHLQHLGLGLSVLSENSLKASFHPIHVPNSALNIKVIFLGNETGKKSNPISKWDVRIGGR